MYIEICTYIMYVHMITPCVTQTASKHCKLQTNAGFFLIKCWFLFTVCAFSCTYPKTQFGVTTNDPKSPRPNSQTAKTYQKKSKSLQDQKSKGQNQSKKSTSKNPKTPESKPFHIYGVVQQSLECWMFVFLDVYIFWILRSLDSGIWDCSFLNCECLLCVLFGLCCCIRMFYLILNAVSW